MMCWREGKDYDNNGVRMIMRTKSRKTLGAGGASRFLARSSFLQAAILTEENYTASNVVTMRDNYIQ
jgi:hypothetical protein